MMNPVSPETGTEFYRGMSFLILLTSIFFVNFMARIVLSPLLPVIESDLHFNHAQAGSLFLTLSSGYFISLLGSSFFSARFSHRRTLLISGGALGAALVGVGLSSGLGTMRAALFLVGLGAGLYLPSAIVLITTAFHKQHWGKALAIHELAPNISFVAAPFLAEIVMRHFSWRGVFHFLGSVALAQAVLFMRLSGSGDFCGTSPSLSSFRTIFSTALFWRMVLLFGLGISGTLGLFAMLPVFLVSAHDFERTSANTLVALSRAAGAVAVFGGGWLTDRLGAKKVLILVFLLSGSMTCLIGLAGSRHVILPLLIQPVIAVCFFPAGFASLSQQSRPEIRNLMVSVTVPIAFFTGGGIVPALMGFLGQAATFQSAFFLIGGLIAAGALLACRIPEENPSKNP